MPLRPTLVEHIARLLACVVALHVLGACTRGEDPPTVAETLGAIAGTVTYPEQIALTEAAVLEVQLLDVSLIDAPAAVVSQQRIRNPGQLPMHFRLEYPENRIDLSHRYTVQVRIFEGEQLAFATDTAYPVITLGNPQIVEVAVVRIGSDPGVANGELIATEPPLEGTLGTGAVSARYAAYFADGKLVRLLEDRDLGADGKAGAEYQFKEGRLLRYVELGRYLDGTSGSGRSNVVEIDLLFDDTGELLAAMRTVNDLPEKPAGVEIDAARNRAELLRNHALALRASRTHAQH